MVNDITVYGVKIDPKGARKGARQVNRSIDSIGASTEKARSKLKALAVSFGLIGAGLIANKVKKLDDTWTDLTNKVKVSTDATEDLGDTMKQLMQTAIVTGAGIDNISRVYAKLALATKGSSFESKNMIPIVETLFKQLKIGGSSAAEGASAMLQFSQGIGSARLGGEELKAIMEGAVGVTLGLVEGFKILKKEGVIDFDVTMGNLRELGATGKLAPEVTLKAIQRMGKVTDLEFKTMTFTMESTMTRVNNKLLEYIGTSEKVNDIVKKTNVMLNYIADNFSAVANTVLNLTAVVLSAAGAWMAYGTAMMFIKTVAVIRPIIALTVALIDLRFALISIKLIAIAGTIKTAVVAFASLTRTIYLTTGALGVFRAAMVAIKLSLAPLLGVVGLVAGVASVLYTFKKEIGDAFDKYVTGSKAIVEATEKNVEVMNTLVETNKKVKQSFSDVSYWKTAIDAFQAGVKEMGNSLNTQKGLTDAYKQVSMDAIDSLVDFAVSGKASFKDMARSIIMDIQRIYLKSKILEGLNSSGLLGGAVRSSGVGVSQGSGGGYQVRGSWAGGGSTGNGPRAGGLDGQGGFLGIIHPKETIVDNAKGDVGNVVNITYAPQINSLDPQTASTVIASNAETIIGVIRQAYARQGSIVAI